MTVGVRLATVLAGLAAALQLGCASAGSVGMRSAGSSGAARDGFEGWLARGDVAAAERTFRAAVEADPGDAWALTGLAMLARRSLDASAEAGHLLSVVRAAPADAIALAALERLAELARVGPDLDRAIEEGLAPLAADGRLRGVAAFRARVARIAAAESSGDVAAVARLRREYGVATEWTLVGPISPLGAMDFDAPLPTGDGRLPAEAPVVPGAPPAPARRIPTPDGVLSLPGELASGLHLAAADAQLARGGRYLLVLWAQGSARVEVDGAKVAERRAFARHEPTTQAWEIDLSRGLHRLAVRFAPGTEGGSVAVALSPTDGSSSDATWTAPAPGPLPAAVPVGRALEQPWTAAKLAAALEPGGGPVLARLLAARSVLRFDREGAKALLAEAAERAPDAVPVRVTLGDALAGDPTLDGQVARSRGESELRRALARDAGDAEARLELSALLRTSDRAADAEAALAELPATVASHPQALVERAMVARARGAPERADALAASATGSCAASELLYDSAVSRDALAAQDAAAGALAKCRGGRERLVRHLEKRGQFAAALEALAPVAAARPAELDGAITRAGLRAAMGDPAAAALELAQAAALWPESPRLWKKIAGLREQAGDRAGARAALERALAADGSDLELRRALALEDGREVLDELREDGAAAIRAYEGSAAARDTSTALVLDADAQEFHPGGAITDRTHQIVHVLDQRGVDRYGEVQLPPGAQVLTLRTRKPDGTTFEPDGGSGKGAISLSGLEPGDYVELEYLRSTRGALDGHAGDAFYFQDEGERLVRSTWVATAPAALGVEVDAHGMEPPPFERSGDRVVLRALRTDVPGLVGEPGAPRARELLPSLQLGYGAGRDTLQRRMAEAVAPRTRPTLEIAALARELRAAAGADAEPELLARAAWTVVATRVTGGPGSLVDDASEVLSRGRGSRLILLKALLGGLGIEARIALVRPFEADPRPYRFPRHGLYGAPLLRVRLEGKELWLDPNQRDAPFGAIPSDLLDAEALVLPSPGEPLEVVRTPAQAAVPSGRSGEVRIVLDAEGGALVEGRDRYRGWTAGEVRGALERFDAGSRRRVFEQSVAGTFRGGSLDALELKGTDDREGDLEVVYRARVPAFARRDGAGLVVESAILPPHLGEGFVRVAERKLPLLVAPQDPLLQRVVLVPPAGLALRAAPDVTLEARWGRYTRKETIEGAALVREERLELSRGRIPPADYPDFARFVTRIDAVQGAPIRLGGEPNPGGPP